MNDLYHWISFLIGFGLWISMWTFTDAVIHEYELNNIQVIKICIITFLCLFTIVYCNNSIKL
jgi:hypothetical protein